MRDKQYKFKIELYEATITYIITTNLPKVSNNIKKGTGLAEDFGNKEGESIQINDNYYIVLDEKHLSHNLINHETYHITEFLLCRTGIDDNEAGAWLQGYLAEQFYKFLRKKNITLYE